MCKRIPLIKCYFLHRGSSTAPSIIRKGSVAVGLSKFTGRIALPLDSVRLDERQRRNSVLNPIQIDFPGKFSMTHLIWKFSGTQYTL